MEPQKKQHRSQKDPLSNKLVSPPDSTALNYDVAKRMESTVKREKSRLHEVRNLLDSELKRNLILQNRLNSHLEKETYMQHERDILRKQALHHKLRLDQTTLLADKERARAESLKIKLTQVLAHVHAKTRYASPLRTLQNQFHNAEENENYLAYKLGQGKKLVEEKVNVNINITTSNDNVYGVPLGDCSKGAFIQQCSRHFVKKTEGKLF